MPSIPATCRPCLQPFIREAGSAATIRLIEQYGGTRTRAFYNAVQSHSLAQILDLGVFERPVRVAKRNSNGAPLDTARSRA